MRRNIESEGTTLARDVFIPDGGEGLGVGTRLRIPDLFPEGTIICALKKREKTFLFWQLVEKGENARLCPQEEVYWLSTLARKELIEKKDLPFSHPNSDSHFQPIESESPNITLAAITPAAQKRHRKEIEEALLKSAMNEKKT